EFGRAGDLAACGAPMRLIVTVTREDEVRRVKSRFSRPVILEVFHTIDVNRTLRIATVDVEVGQGPDEATPIGAGLHVNTTRLWRRRVAPRRGYTTLRAIEDRIGRGAVCGILGLGTVLEIT